MFGDVNPSSSVVHFVNVKNNRGTKRIRVNVVYERGLQTNLATLGERANWLDDTPPPLDLEGYEDEIPEWGGVEQEISSGNSDWNSCGEQETQDIETSPSTSSVLCWSGLSCTSNVDINHASPRYPSLLKRKASVRRRCSYASAYVRSSRLTDVGRNTMTRNESHLSGVKPAEEFMYIPTPSEEYYGSKRQLIQGNQQSELQSGRIAFCRLCEVQVKSTLRRTHIYLHHLQRPLYKCPHCDISSTYHLTNIRVHIRKIHNSVDEPICFKDKFEDDINCFLYRCFGDRQIFRRQDPDVIGCLGDILNYVCESVPLHSSGGVPNGGLPPFALLASTGSGQLMNGVISAESAVPEPAFNVRSQPRNTCRLCFETNVKHLERHVLQYHIKKPMYLCAYCSFSSCYSPASVKDHIKTKHNMFNPIPVDVRDEYTELIQSTYDQCFVDDSAPFLSRIFSNRQPSDRLDFSTGR